MTPVSSAPAPAAAPVSTARPMSTLNQLSLHGKVIVITGATSVLGEALSLAVAEARVATPGRDAGRFVTSETVLSSFNAYGGV
jgi:hypothetical protein